MTEFLYHYYDEATGPFCNLSDLASLEAEQVMNRLRSHGKGFASKRSSDYMLIRRTLEAKARSMFEQKGGKPIRSSPHYMTLGRCPWLMEWYPDGKELSIPLNEFDPLAISFTYGDLFPTMRYEDDKPYRKNVYTVVEIFELIEQYGYPQEWNADGSHGPERYIEAQIWDDAPLMKYR